MVFYSVGNYPTNDFACNYDFSALLVVVDSNYNIMQASDIIKKWLGFEPSDIIGKNLSVIIEDNLDLSDKNSKGNIYLKNNLGKNKHKYYMDVCTYEIDSKTYYTLSFIDKDKNISIIEYGRESVEDLFFVKNEFDLLRNLLRAVGDANNVEEALSKIITIICREMGWNIGHAYMVNDSSDEVLLEPSDVWYISAKGKYDHFIEETNKTVFKSGEGLIGKVYETGETKWVSDTINNSSFIRCDGDANIKSGFAFPIKAKGKVLAVLEFYVDELSNSNRKLMDTIVHIKGPLGTFMLQKSAEDELRKNEAMLATIMDNIVDSMLITNEKGIIIGFGGASEKMFGYTEKEVVGKSVKFLMPEKYRAAHDDNIRNYFNKGGGPIKAGNREFYAQRKNKEIFPVDIALGLADIDGEKLFIGLLRDITERKIEQQEIEQFKQTLDSTLDSVLIFDAETTQFVYANQGAIDSLGYSLDEIKDIRAYDIMPEFDDKEFKNLLSDIINSDEKYVNIETLYRNKKGEIFPVSDFIQYVEIVGQKPRFVNIVRDITDKQETERRLREAAYVAESADRAKTEFLARMSHEIRTPLNGIIGTVSVLEKTDLGKKQKEYTSVVSRSAEGLLFILNEILDFSKIEAGKMTLSNEVFDLFTAVDDVYQLFSSLAKEKNIDFEVIYPKNAGSVFIGDVIRIKQILTNLINNSFKFTDKGSIKIFIDYIQQDDDNINARFSIVDTGCGMRNNEVEDIFKSFTQIDIGGANRQAGTGLGLAICKSLVEMMGGDIWVESQENVGSSFIFDIIIGKSSPDKLTIKCLKQEEYVDIKYGYNILLVEDVDVNVFIVTEMMDYFNCKYDIARNGKEAVEIFAINPDKYDLILMDINMPIMDGMEATKIIRTMGAKMPIVALTANIMSGDTENYLAGGFNTILNKPVSLQDMAKCFYKLKFGNDIVIDNKDINDDCTVYSIIDDSIIKQYGDNASKIIRLTIKDTDNFIVDIEKGFDNNDKELIRLSAHSMKSILAAVGALEASELIAEIEKEVKEVNIEKIRKMYNLYKEKYSNVRKALLKYTNNH